MIFSRVQCMIRRHHAMPRWGWDYEHPIAEVHGFDVQFTGDGLVLELLGKESVVARALLPFGGVQVALQREQALAEQLAAATKRVAGEPSDG